MGNIRDGGTSFLLSPALAASGGEWPRPPQSCYPPTSSNKPQKFLGAMLSGGLQSTAAPVGSGDCGEGSEKEIGRWQAGHTERGPSRGTGDLKAIALSPSLVPKNLFGFRPVGRQATSGDLNGFANFPDS